MSCSRCRNRASNSEPCERCIRIMREAAELEDGLRTHPVAAVYSLLRDLDHLADAERDRGLDWLSNHLGRLRALSATGELAEVGRQKLYAAERHRAQLALAAELEDDRLLPDVEKLAAAGEPAKVIADRLGKMLGRKESEPFGVARAGRLVRKARQRAAYRAKFAPNR